MVSKVHETALLLVARTIHFAQQLCYPQGLVPAGLSLFGWRSNNWVQVRDGEQQRGDGGERIGWGGGWKDRRKRRQYSSMDHNCDSGDSCDHGVPGPTWYEAGLEFLAWNIWTRKVDSFPYRKNGMLKNFGMGYLVKRTFSKEELKWTK